MLLVFKELLLMRLKWSPAFTQQECGTMYYTHVVLNHILDIFYVEPSLSSPHSQCHTIISPVNIYNRTIYYI